MKKQSLRVAPVANPNFSFLVIALLLLIVNTTVLQAHTISQDTTINTTTPVALVKHIGMDGSNMLFQVQYENVTGKKFSLIIKDKDGNTLFQQTYTDKKFDKKFHVPKTDNDQLTFIIRVAKTSAVIQTFEVNTNTRVIEEIVVKRQG